MSKASRPMLATLKRGVSAQATVRVADARDRAVPAVRRAIGILQYLARTGDGQTVSRIAGEVEIIPSTCLRILRELLAAHLVAFEPNGKTYKLGFGVLLLAKELTAHDAFIHAAQPRLEIFAREYGVSVSAQEREGDESVVLSAVTATEGLEAPLGLRVPALSAASGKVLAAHSGWSRAQLLSRFERVRWQLRPDFDQWLDEVNEAKATGYAVDTGQFRIGVTSISVGVAGRDGTVWRTISVNVVSAQLDAKRSDKLLAGMLKMANDVSRAISGA